MKKQPLKLVLLVGIPFLLTSCWWLNDSDGITVHERYASQRAYFEKYIKPINPDADKGSFSAYQFLKKKIDVNKRTLLLAAWEKYNDEENWYLEIESVRFEFTCRLSISTYSFHSKDFISVQDCYLSGLMTMEELEGAFNLLNEYVKKS